ncbi:alpha-(1,3)-fucosyltransferase 6-like [Acanthaster planci]|uniref:Fucosyltransferase n=1 Tax=Acanthaster planci TaxID=133434 RepID=A0A8B7ZZ12_ACAPL|nr:alpha-(1,3)-fucosyltransferase 6-like [Acanthaster planci]
MARLLRIQLLTVLAVAMIGVDIVIRLRAMEKTVISSPSYRRTPPKPPLLVSKGNTRPRSSIFTRAANDTVGKFDGMGNLVSKIRDPCNYKVQIYDRKGILLKERSDTFRNIAPRKKGRRNIPVSVQCGGNSTVTVTIGDEKRKFKGMDAVLFHLCLRLVPPRSLPVGMNPKQAWVFCSWETPYISTAPQFRIKEIDVPSLSGFTANAAWTYHRTSEITTQFGFYEHGKPMVNKTRTVDEWVQGKTDLVLWMGSNCGITSWPRLKFVEKLQSYIPVDMYGRCGNLTCEPRSSPKCNEELVRKYKFYLALENSECEEYITEKMWDRTLLLGVVPIVYGASRKDYEEFLPPNSFIYVGDYNTVKELADYLKLLDSRPDLYAKYFEWKYKGRVSTTKVFYSPFDPSRFCHLIPIIEKVRRGELPREPVLSSHFFQTCREKPNSVVDGWNPW